MHISWHGHFTVRLQTTDGVIVIDPHGATDGLTAVRGKPDLVALSNPTDEAMSHIDGLQGEASLIDTPGEYSISGLKLFARGWDAPGGERSFMRWTIEGMTILHIGAITRPLEDDELADVQRANIDILLVPVGGHTSLTTEQAIDLVGTIEPRVVIPINYATSAKSKLAKVDAFAKEMGVSPKSTEKKIIVKPKTLPTDEVQTIILAAA